MKVNGLAYVNLDPDNGGVILDISEGGLCFQSTAPVRRTEMIRFWFSYRGHHMESGRGLAGDAEIQTRGVSRLIEVRSELAWMDNTLKRGGLRFTNLSDTARQQIRDWIREPALVHVNGGAVGLIPSVRQSGTQLARVASARMDAVYRRLRSARVWNEFSGGVVAGVFCSACLVGLVLLATHAHVLGDSLIQIGQRLGGRSWAQAVSAAQGKPQTRSDSTAAATRAAESGPDLEPRATAVPDVPAETVLSTETPQTAKRAEPKHEDAATVTLPVPKVQMVPKVQTASHPSVPSPAAGQALVKNAPPASSPADLVAGVARAVPPEMELANRAVMNIQPVRPGNVDSSGMHSEKFLEVGKFKEKVLADETSTRLTNLGYPATVMQKAHLFGKSFQVLVGPYNTDPEAETIHKELATRGFSPRSYERGKREFRMPSDLRVGGTRLPVGDCTITWESYKPDAIVKFVDQRGAGVTVQGKWVRQGVKYGQNAVGYERNRDGSHTLLEIRFAGMEETLVFGGG
jgi:PilZ domain